MLISEYDYDLPHQLIAQTASSERDGSRMLVVDRSSSSFQDARFADLPDQLRSDDVLVINNTKVFPARLFGQSETGAKVEVFLIRHTRSNHWEALARPAKRLPSGKTIIFSERLAAKVIDKLPDGKILIQFLHDGDVDELIDEVGSTPLPPYVKRDPNAADIDQERYQTVYAQKRGAIAAPTAGLHFTSDVLDRIRAKGVTVAQITLHVGYGTFEPVRVSDVSEHTVKPENYEISAETADTLNSAKRAGRRFVAVGTTTTRALESAMATHDEFVPGPSVADLTITPGYRFRAVNALLTNFHLPQSSLLVLTSTFGGHQLIMGAYRHAVAEKYRFYSYGDCMLIV